MWKRFKVYVIRLDNGNGPELRYIKRARYELGNYCPACRMCFLDKALKRCPICGRLLRISNVRLRNREPVNRVDPAARGISIDA